MRNLKDLEALVRLHHATLRMNGDRIAPVLVQAARQAEHDAAVASLAARAAAVAVKRGQGTCLK